MRSSENDFIGPGPLTDKLCFVSLIPEASAQDGERDMRSPADNINSAEKKGPAARKDAVRISL